MPRTSGFDLAEVVGTEWAKLLGKSLLGRGTNLCRLSVSGSKELKEGLCGLNPHSSPRKWILAHFYK